MKDEILNIHTAAKHQFKERKRAREKVLTIITAHSIRAKLFLD
jgi:hypothetical protein